MNIFDQSLLPDYEVSSLFENSSTDEEIDINHEYIYPGSYLDVDDFVFSFLFLCKQLKLSKKSRDILLKYIKALLPSQNKILNSYKVIINKTIIKNSRAQCFKMCPLCSKKEDGHKCSNDVCPASFNLNDLLNSHKLCDVVLFDFVSELKFVIGKNAEQIRKYKSLVSTITQKKLLDTDMNTISLIIFVDGAAFSKTGRKGSMWSMFAMVLDLPLPLRFYSKNIITLFLIGASNPDLNGFIREHMNQLHNITQCGKNLLFNSIFFYFSSIIYL